MNSRNLKAGVWAALVLATLPAVSGCSPAAGPAAPAGSGGAAGQAMPTPSPQEQQKTLDKTSVGPVTDGNQETPVTK